MVILFIRIGKINYGDYSWLKLTLCFALADGDGLESASKCFKLTNETYQQDIKMRVP
jgi:hypothetical protein